MNQSSGAGSLVENKKIRSPVYHHVPGFLWNKYKDEIGQLYVHSDPPQSLSQIVKHMQNEHGFIATYVVTVFFRTEY